MSKKRFMALGLAGILSLSMFTACGSQGGENSSSANSSKPSGESQTVAADDYSEPYKFTHYYNFDWWQLREWGGDDVSAYLKDKFNVEVEFSKPDADPNAYLNMLIASNSLPDSIFMDKTPEYIQMAKKGYFTDITDLKKNSPYYDEAILSTTQDLLKVDGKLYAIPNWPRSEPSGGNECWMYDKRIYEEVGSPKLETFEDLYNFAKLVKDKVPNTKENLPVIPFSTAESSDGGAVLRAFYRSFGGPNMSNPSKWYGRVDGKYSLLFRDPAFKEATMEANKWYREGLLVSTNFTDTWEQIVEKLTAARAGLIYYDFSADAWNNFRKLVVEKYNDDYVIINQPNLYPPAKGIDPSKIYGEEKSTVGGSVIVITKNAKNPQRIFDMWSYMLSKEGTATFMYGPKGGLLWDKTDDNGNPVLKMAESDLTPEQRDKLGIWMYYPAQANVLDTMKYEVSKQLPEDKQDRISKIQTEIFTPHLFMTDEYVNVQNAIAAESDLNIKKTLCEDKITAMAPQIIMASSAEEAGKLYDDLVMFCDQTGMPEIEKAFDEVYQSNIKLQGFTAYSK